MIGGMSFSDVQAEYPWVAGDSGCDFEGVGADFLYRHGFAYQRIWKHHPGPVVKAEQNWEEIYAERGRKPWPPEPWALAHLCTVETSQYHCVVMLRDGTVLDPATSDPKRLSDYKSVAQVWGLYDIR